MLKFNWVKLHREIEDINKLSDEFERDIRLQFVYDIIEKINDYNEHTSKYEYIRKRQEIENRGVIFVPQSKPNNIKSKWTRLFASTVGSDVKKEIGYENYKWHIFSFEKVKALTNSKARQAFNKCKKCNVYLFYQHKDEAFYIENPHLLKSSDFDSEDDIYIFDTIRKWTYVHTHEVQCGPYFYRL